MIRNFRTRGLSIGYAAFILLFLLALAFNLSPYLRGPDEWRWAYALPGQPPRLLFPLLGIVAYLLSVGFWLKKDAPNPKLYLWLLLPSYTLLQLSLLALDHPDVLVPLFYRTISAGESGVFTVGATIQSGVEFLRHYPSLMPTFPVHPQRYPPGLSLLFYWTRLLLDHMPALADAIGFHLRHYQCHNFDLMRLPNVTLATSVIQMALPFLSGLTLFPLHSLARRLYGTRMAMWAVALYPLIPSVALWSARWEQLFPLLTCSIWYFFYLGTVEFRRGAMVLAGAGLALALFFNFSFMALLLPLGLFWLLRFLQQTAPSLSAWLRAPLLSLGLWFLVGLIAPWLIYQLAFGSGFLDIWRVSMAYHLGLARSYWTWLGYHLYDFFLFLGLPLTLLIPMAFRKTLRTPAGHFALSVILGLLLLDLSGTARGEVARVWLFLTPLALLVAVRGLETWDSWGTRMLVLGLLGLQLFTFNTFLRVVTTGIEDPPHREPRFTCPAISHPVDARFGDAIALLGYDLAQSDDSLRVTLYWQALRPMGRPYTVFVHLIAPDGQIAAQQDAMPQQGAAPTSCWRPGEFITDPYTLTLPAQLPPGRYRLETGWYFWETGERLPVAGVEAPDNAVPLTWIQVPHE